jgi:hypothetical protein
MNRLFRYVGVREPFIDDVYNKFHYWSFMKSISKYLEKNGKLSEKQYNAVCRQLLKKGYSTLPYSIKSDSRYHRRGSSNSSKRTHIPNKYGCERIDVYDLPMASGKEYTVRLEKHNDTSSYIHIKDIGDRVFLIPKPTNIANGLVKVRYNRTECKGFLKEVIGE